MEKHGRREKRGREVKLKTAWEMEKTPGRDEVKQREFTTRVKRKEGYEDGGERNSGMEKCVEERDRETETEKERENF